MKTTKARTWVAAASLTLCTGGLAFLPASAAHASVTSDPNWMNLSTLPDLGTCAPMMPGYSINDGTADQIPCVGALQDSLAAVGFSGLQIDGLYGADTWSAVWRFQSAHQLPATGDADAQTIALLDQVANSTAASSDNGASLQAPPAPAIPGTINGESYADVEPDVTTPDDNNDDYVP